MREPRNSWEISYVILCKKPYIDLGVTMDSLLSKVSYSRRAELNEWAWEGFSYKWFIEHV